MAKPRRITRFGHNRLSDALPIGPQSSIGGANAESSEHAHCSIVVETAVWLLRCGLPGHPLRRLSHDAIQPTLHARHEGSLADRISGLPSVDAVALAAFEASREDPAPIAPTLRFTFELAARLRLAHVLRLLEETPRRLDWGQARAIYDPSPGCICLIRPT